MTIVSNPDRAMTVREWIRCFNVRVFAKITWHFGISSSHHLRPLLNREILNVDPATPAVSLNRSRPNLVQT